MNYGRRTPYLYRHFVVCLLLVEGITSLSSALYQPELAVNRRLKCLDRVLAREPKCLRAVAQGSWPAPSRPEHSTFMPAGRKARKPISLLPPARYGRNGSP